MSKIYIKRNWNYIGMAIKFRAAIDGVEHPQFIANNQIIEIDVTPGIHELAIKQKLNPKTKTQFTIADGEEIYFETGVSKIILLFLGISLFSLLLLNFNILGLVFSFILAISSLIGIMIYVFVMKKSYYIREIRRSNNGAAINESL